MKLYEVNEAIAEIFDKLIDPETGEVSENSDELMKELDAMQMEHKNILEYLAKLVLNSRSEASALKEEEKRLEGRRKGIEKKEKALMAVLDRECNGEKTNLGVATVSYRKTAHVDVSDAYKAFKWLRENDHPDCYKVPEPEIAKSEVKKLIKHGTKVPGCKLVDGISCSLR